MSKEETGLTLTTGLHTPPAITVDQLQHYGRIFFESGMFPDIRSAAQAEVKVMAGIELGLAPLYSMTKIYIVKGRVMVGAEALGAMVKRSGRYDYKVVKLTDTECDMQFTDKGEAVYLSHFTIEDARRADLMQPGGGWFKWPRAMLVSKAVSQGARIVCPEVIAGVYTPEDFGGATNPATGEVEGLAVIPPAETIPVAVSQAPVPNLTAQGDKKVETITATPRPVVEHTPCKNIGDFLNCSFKEFGLVKGKAIKEAGYARQEDISDPEQAYQNVKAGQEKAP